MERGLKKNVWIFGGSFLGFEEEVEEVRSEGVEVERSKCVERR